MLNDNVEEVLSKAIQKQTKSNLHFLSQNERDPQIQMGPRKT
jgi:hypothetical protein